MLVGYDDDPIVLDRAGVREGLLQIGNALLWRFDPITSIARHDEHIRVASGDLLDTDLCIARFQIREDIGATGEIEHILPRPRAKDIERPLTGIVVHDLSLIHI